MRIEAGLTQQQLAALVGTTQSVISRLEDADYDGHSLSILNRIAAALQKKLTVTMTAKDPEIRFWISMQLLLPQYSFSSLRFVLWPPISRKPALF